MSRVKNRKKRKLPRKAFKFKPWVDWEEIRRRWEAGETDSAIALDHDVHRTRIGQVRRKEGWDASKRPVIDWPEIRKRWEAGEAAYSIARDHGVDHTRIHQLKEAEAWDTTNRPKPRDWERLRRQWEAGKQIGAIVREHGISQPAVSQHKNKGQWVPKNKEMKDVVVSAALNEGMQAYKGEHNQQASQQVSAGQ